MSGPKDGGVSGPKGAGSGGQNGGGVSRARLTAALISGWAPVTLLAMIAVAVIGWAAFPTYPTYDSFYALLWGRDLLHLHLPDFGVYRAPTEHPLAIAFGAVCSLLGNGGARLMVLGSVISFVVLVAGLYQLAKLCFGTVVGVVAGLLALSCFYFENLAAQGYLDISYMALVAWAAALEAGRSRRGTPVQMLLAAAGLLRPDAWVLAGAYWLWLEWPHRDDRFVNAPRARRLGLALLAPVLWMAVDGIVTGNPLHSFSSTTELASELGRASGLAGTIPAVWNYLVRIDKLPVLLAGLIGIALSLTLTPRRALMPLVVFLLQVLVFVAEGAVGASVIYRYAVGAAAFLLPFSAVTIAGWSLLERGSWLRRAWIAGAVVLVLAGGASTAEKISLTNLRNTLAYHEDFHAGLAQALRSPAVAAAAKRCGTISLPDNKLIPDARWIMNSTGQRNIIARSDARSEAEAGRPSLRRRLQRGSVAIYPLGAAVFYEAIVDVGDNPLDQVPPRGYERLYTSGYYAVYANC